jgi:hypothetical protein
LLARSIHIVVFAIGSLCAGCQALDHAEPRLERTPRLVAGLAYTMSPGPVARAAELTAYNGDDVWQRLARRCTLADGQGNERIARQRGWLLSNRGFLRGASQRASPYLHFIVERLDERQMPLELALLPIIESAYNPMANSPRAAAGLWQFIPSTGRDFNLPQNASYNARRDVVASSKAAMDYLSRLHDQFDNDWLLALAAYNAGEGTVGRAIEANRRRGRTRQRSARRSSASPARQGKSRISLRLQPCRFPDSGVLEGREHGLQSGRPFHATLGRAIRDCAFSRCAETLGARRPLLRPPRFPYRRQSARSRCLWRGHD